MGIRTPEPQKPAEPAKQPEKPTRVSGLAFELGKLQASFNSLSTKVAEQDAKLKAFRDQLSGNIAVTQKLLEGFARLERDLDERYMPKGIYYGRKFE